MPGEAPDLNLLLVFEAMFRHGSVTRAAAQIGLTQSAMSSALGRLRRQFGDPLFVNTRSGVLPTPRAPELAPPLTEALASPDESAFGPEEEPGSGKGARGGQRVSVEHDQAAHFRPFPSGRPESFSSRYPPRLQR